LSEAALVKIFPLVAIGLLLVGCNRDGGNKADAALAAEYVQLLQAWNPGMTDACVRKIRAGEIGTHDYFDSPDCFEMLPDQRWSGLWSTNGEYSTFCPDGTKECVTNGGITLRFTDRSAPRESLPLGEYHTEFIGRRTKVPGHHGQLNVYAHFIIVDRVISIQKIPGQKYIKLF
jgi:hypothetical protein